MNKKQQKENERIQALFEYKNWTPEKLKEKIDRKTKRNKRSSK